MQFKRETDIRNVIGEAMPLIRQAHAEISGFPDLEPDPDIEVYETLERGGALRFFSAREDDGRLVGYSVYVVTRSLHFSRLVQANHDVLYLEPGSRGRGTGASFLRYCDGMLQAEGVEVIFMHTSLKKDLGPLFARLGYSLLEHGYFKRCGS